MRLSRRVPLASAVVGVVLLAGCGAGPAPVHPARTAQSAATVTSAPPAPSSTVPSSTVPSSTVPSSPRPSATAPPNALPVAPGAGDRPQTSAFPSTHSTAFRNAMTDLWLAVTTGNSGLALPAFFPLAAYQQVKAIPYPAADWHDRLWYDFNLDVGAAHELAGSHARLVRVIVPTSDAVWVPPGACANKLCYWHVPQSRVVYSEHGAERSFGIADIISWRGVWYVVHLGAVLRSVVTGIVDQPESGPGIPGPAGGC
jgi:hypothetical protein